MTNHYPLLRGKRNHFLQFLLFSTLFIFLFGSNNVLHATENAFDEPTSCNLSYSVVSKKCNNENSFNLQLRVNNSSCANVAPVGTKVTYTAYSSGSMPTGFNGGLVPVQYRKKSGGEDILGNFTLKWNYSNATAGYYKDLDNPAPGFGGSHDVFNKQTLWYPLFSFGSKAAIYPAEWKWNPNMIPECWKVTAASFPATIYGNTAAFQAKNSVQSWIDGGDYKIEVDGGKGDWRFDGHEFTITKVCSNSCNGFEVLYNNRVVGTGSYGQTITLQNLPTTNVTLKIRDKNSSSCVRTITVTSPNCDPCAALGGDNDGDGVCKNEDCDDNNPNLPATPGTACNDGNPNTDNDVIQADGCSCAGIDPCAALGGDYDGDGVCKDQDCDDNNPNLPAMPGTACNDGNPNTNNDVIQADGCSCAGVIVDPCAALGGDNDGDGVCKNEDCDDNNPNLPAMPGTACNDGNPNTDNDVIQADGCSCAGIDPCAALGGDYDGDGVCKDQDCDDNNPNLPAMPGTACNDGNPNTNNDVIQADGCSCAGIITQPICDNVTFGGKIGFGSVCSGTHEICGTSGNAPIIGSCSLPTGGSGDLEYIWLRNNISCNGPTGTVAQMLANPNAYNWKIIPNSNAPTYHPGILSSSTCYLRCVRRAGCDSYQGESNIVRIEVNPNCGTGGGTITETCDGGASITYGNGSIQMQGGSFYQIFDRKWNTIYNCGWQCGNSKTVDNLEEGEYRVIIKNGSYDNICEKVIYLTVGGGNTGGGDPDNDNDGVPASQDCNDNDANLTTVGAACNDGNGTTENDVVQANCTCAGTTIDNGGSNSGNTGGTTESCDNGTSITYGNGSIRMEGQSGQEYYFQVLNAAWQEEYNCGWQCGNSKTVDGLATGEYRVYIKNSSYQVICEKVISLTAGGGNTGGGDPDNDNDGVPASQDCNDNDANLTTVGATCNDGDGTTENDVVQANCTCAGTAIDNGGNTGGGNETTCGEITVTYGNGTIAMTGITGNEYFFKINDLNQGWAQVGGCGWNCGYQFTASELPNSRYLVSIYNSDWSEHCATEIEMTNSNFSGSAGSRNAPQLTFSAFSAKQEVALQWLTNSGYKVSNFEVERSVDGENFQTIAQFVNKEWTEELEYHQTLDEHPIKGANYYRIKEIYLDGSFSYTDVQNVGFYLDLEGFAMYPNPTKDNLNFNLRPFMDKAINISIVNHLGQAVKTIEVEKVSHDNLQLSLVDMPNGFYQVLIQIDGQKAINKKLIVERLY